MSNKPSTTGPAWYVSGVVQGGGASFGTPCESKEAAADICAKAHYAGYRQLRVYQRNNQQVWRYHIRYGLIPTNEGSELKE